MDLILSGCFKLGDITLFLIYIIVGLAWCFGFGFAAYETIKNRGYNKSTAQSWFFVGFFFGVIGLLLTLTKPDLRALNSNGSNMQVNNPAPISKADELKKFKDLLDSGAITEEEFNHQKQKLLY